MFAQANKEIPCLGTTHADYFHGPIPVTRMITEEEIKENYEKNTGKIVVERLAGLDPLEMPEFWSWVMGFSPEEDLPGRQS